LDKASSRFIRSGRGIEASCLPYPFGLSLSKAWFELAPRLVLLRPDAALSPRRATYISLSRQRNLRKRKATLVPASLRCATGNLRCSAQPESRSNSPAAQTIAGPDPSGLPLLGAFTRAWGSEFGVNFKQFNVDDRRATTAHQAPKSGDHARRRC
jgi:hypothetical protein